ncbi:MAG TPA: hypothetical protein VK813_10055 [Edaphobacter sp.]|nr:hypothetical protein [Edaphobacter sp.]
MRAANEFPGLRQRRVIHVLAYSNRGTDSTARTTNQGRPAVLSSALAARISAPASATRAAAPASTRTSARAAAPLSSAFAATQAAARASTTTSA